MTHMQRAIGLARQVLGSTSPNPAVGAVIVRDGLEIGCGSTLPPGQRHAEIGALEQAGEASKGATLYTSLEPCCNFGRTPPCTQAIIAAGIARVHLAALDPNPRVLGQGCAELRSAGIEVVIGEESESAHEIYEAFAKHVTTGIPFVSAKFAMSLDGKIATRTGDSKWVTSPESRSMVQQMRRETDGILVGVNTVLADDPRLTARGPDGNPLPRQPLRVVVDSRCRTPGESGLFGQTGHTLIACTEKAPSENVARLERAGAEVLHLPSGEDGRVNLGELLAELGRRDVVSLMAEGGGTVLGSLFDAGLVDKVYAFIAPLIIGGSRASSPVEGRGAEHMAGAWRMEGASFQTVGPDWLVVGYPEKKGQDVYWNS
jgi:diaminohydroxyphosphoribosylaminopyrimidine deaminase/5-amino-6-(5-phosphoribosylamino)uracil reductase